MKKLSNGNLYTRDEFRERVENGLFIGEGQYSNENGQVNGYPLLPLHQMRSTIWNIHM